jgi:hypothetical protein
MIPFKHLLLFLPNPRWVLGLLAVVWLQSVSAAPLRIMPIGDSITAGYTDNPPSGGTGGWTVPFEFGYRRQLYQSLTSAGYDFVFVGASQEPWVSVYGDPTHGGTVAPSFDLRPLGQDGHRGYGGIRIPQINTNIASYLNSDNPDIILMMIGINGMDTGSPAELATLVNDIFTTKPNVHLILAQITPMSSNVTYAVKNADLVAYNTYIRQTLVPTLQSQGKKISTVDQYRNFLSNPSDPSSAIDASLYSNGINHPTNAAYDSMAATWFDGILAVTPPTLPVLNQTVISPAIPAGGTIGTFAQPPAPSTESLAFTLIAGTGSTDNAKFSINGSELRKGTHNFGADAEGSTYSIRVRATASPSGLVGERVITLSLSVDSDDDLLPDAWEQEKAGNLTDLTQTGDHDEDGLTDTAEYQLSLGAYAGIDPIDPDTDDDGMLDGQEIAGLGLRPPTNPTAADTDADGICDLNEDNTGNFVSVLKTGTNPTLANSDGDSVNDGSEILQFTNPASASSPSSPSYLTVSSSTASAYAANISNSDLLHGLSGASVVYTGWYLNNGAVPTRLNDGLHGGYGTTPVEGGWSQASGSSITYTLPSGTGNGWKITAIHSIADWSGGGFGNQRYEVSVRRVGELGFTALANVNFQPYTATGIGGSRVSITHGTGVLASYVEQIRFVMLGTNGNSGRAVYREFDVEGTASVIPDPEMLSFVSPAGRHGDSTLTWSSHPQQSYRVEASHDLMQWSVLAADYPSGGVTTTFIQAPDPAEISGRFFRVSALP